MHAIYGDNGDDHEGGSRAARQTEEEAWNARLREESLFEQAEAGVSSFGAWGDADDYADADGENGEDWFSAVAAEVAARNAQRAREAREKAEAAAAAAWERAPRRGAGGSTRQAQSLTEPPRQRSVSAEQKKPSADCSSKSSGLESLRCAQRPGRATSRPGCACSHHRRRQAAPQPHLRRCMRLTSHGRRAVYSTGYDSCGRLPRTKWAYTSLAMRRCPTLTRAAKRCEPSCVAGIPTSSWRDTAEGLLPPSGKPCSCW